MNKQQLQERKDNQQKILNVLKLWPDGMLSADIAALTQIPHLTVKRLLVGLRNKGVVMSYDKNTRDHCHIWCINGTPPPVNVVSTVFKPYPKLDKEHSEWLNYKKPVYNPR